MQTPGLRLSAGLALAFGAAACHHAPIVAEAPDTRPEFARVRIESPAGTQRPPYHFSPADEDLLNEVQRGAFNYLWSVGDPAKPGHATGMVPNRTSKPEVSVAGVGFQLSGICIGVERGWITRDQGRDRCLLILNALTNATDNRKAGLFYHFVDPQTGGQGVGGYEKTVSTVDSALLFAGVLTASQFFGGEVQQLGDSLFTDADWSFFVCPPGMRDPTTAGLISLGWQPRDKRDPTGDGHLLPYAWIDSGDEHRLVSFLAACALTDAHRPDPSIYYRQRRAIGEWNGQSMVWFPWSGALFAAFFANCWIDYAHLGLDDPRRLGIDYRPQVDWWENSRRTSLMHRDKAVANPMRLKGFGSDAWGLTASDIPEGYGVPGLFADSKPMPGSVETRDFAQTPKPTTDDWGDGTIAPYGAGSAIMFAPRESVAALRHFRSLRKADGSPLVWANPSAGGYGFFDAYNPSKDWVGRDCLAIDQGPLLLAIENARTGLVWRVFMAHPFVRAGCERLQLRTSK